MVGVGVGGGFGAGTFLSSYQCLKNLTTLWSNMFARFGHITFKLCKFPNFKMLSPAVSMDFWSLSKLNKQRGLLKLHVKTNITCVSKVHVSNICSDLLSIIYLSIVCFFCLTVTVEGSKTNYIQFVCGFFK